MKRLLLFLILAAPLTAQTTATIFERISADVDPLLVSAGLRIRF